MMWQFLGSGMTASMTSHPRSIPVSSKSDYLCSPFYFSLIPNGRGPSLGILLTTQLGINDAFHSSTHTMRLVLTRPWSLYIEDCLEWVLIWSTVSGRYFWLMWANILMLGQGWRPGWCWWCWGFLVGTCQGVETTLFWTLSQFQFVPAVPLISETFSAIVTWVLGLF